VKLLHKKNVIVGKKNIEILLGTNKEVCLEMNEEKSECMFLSCHQNSGQDHNIKTANNSLKNVAMLENLGTTVINQNYIHKLKAD